VPLRRTFVAHTVETAFERGWSELQNGALIDAAEASGFDVFVTTDKNLRYQHNLSSRQLAVLVLWTTSWPQIVPHVTAIALAAAALQPGEYRELSQP